MKPRPVQHIRRMLIGFAPQKGASSLAIEVEREVVAKSAQFSSRSGEHSQQGMSTPPEGRLPGDNGRTIVPPDRLHRAG